MGDLKELRHAIIHGRSILSEDKHRKLKRLAGMFKPGQAITIQYDDMHTIFAAIKQDCARLMLEWLKVPDAQAMAADINDVAIQRGRGGNAAL